MSAGAADRRFLERPRVDRLLEKALESNVITIIAGEGSGKTHAAHSFLEKEGWKTIWVQLSARDNLGWRFWENYTGEMARLNPAAAERFADIGFPESDRQFERYLGLMKNKLVSPERYVVVFDDFHFLNNPALLLFLEKTLSSPVSKGAAVFISRTEPAMNTVHLQAKGLLAQVTADDLRFTREETDAYFRLHQVFLEGEDLERIFRETEGWALALGLILEEIKTYRAGGHRWDRVMLPIRRMEENIFAAMGGDLQKFLVKLSLIERWPRDLLERLEPGGKSVAAMEKFSAVIRFDAYLHGFRIHYLFLEFLREKQGELRGEEIREVYRESARWCLENNLPTDAAVDYARARDYGGLVRLIESLPRVLPRTMAAFLLETAERLIGENREAGEDWDFLFLRFIIHSRLLVLLERFEEAAGDCREAIACFEARPPGPDRSRILAAAYNNLGILSVIASKYTKDYRFAGWFERGCGYYRENPEPVEGQMSQCNIGAYVIQVGFPAAPGEIDAFIDAYSAAVSYMAVSLGGYRFGTDTLARAELAYYQGDLNRAEQFARRAVYQGREKNQCEVENRALFFLMRLAIHSGDIAGIRDLEGQMKAQLEKGEYPHRYNIYDINMGRFYTRLGLTGKIAAWLRTEHEERDLNVIFRGFDSLVKARCLFTEKEYPAALQALEDEKTRGDLWGFLFGMLEMTVLEAAVRHQLGDGEGAFAALKRAYDAGSPHALDMPFIELGETMHGLIGAALKAGAGEIPPDWLCRIQRKASAYAKQRALVAAQYSGGEAPGGPDVSEWELEILRGLSRGRTSEGIASNMKISLNTVKSVIRSLYGKLGAVNRADAIRIATARGLPL
jgi:LuxR family maltose regulon positive regulatory protein